MSNVANDPKSKMDDDLREMLKGINIMSLDFRGISQFQNQDGKRLLSIAMTMLLLLRRAFII